MPMKVNEIIARESIFLENSRLWKSAFLQMVMLRKLEKRKITWDYAFSELGIQKPDDYDDLLRYLDKPDIKRSQQKALLALAMCLGFCATSCCKGSVTILISLLVKNIETAFTVILEKTFNLLFQKLCMSRPVRMVLTEQLGQ